jgi:lipoate-protein ligase A
MGSSQPVTDVDADVADGEGITLVKRRSGGGAVWVHPHESVWIDVTISRTDPLWLDDISESMVWLGDVFVRALAPWVEATVRTEEFDSGRDGRTVCFASASPGEVFVGKSKLVGISQRRTREGARMQCVLYRTWNPLSWVHCLSDPALRDRILQLRVTELRVAASDIVDAVIAALPAE